MTRVAARGRVRAREPRHAARADPAARPRGARGGRRGASRRARRRRALGRRAAADLPGLGARARAASCCCSTSPRRSSIPTARRRSSISFRASPRERGTAVLVSEQRRWRCALERCDRVVTLGCVRSRRPAAGVRAARRARARLRSRGGLVRLRRPAGALRCLARAAARRGRRADRPERLREDDAGQARRGAARARHPAGWSGRDAPRSSSRTRAATSSASGPTRRLRSARIPSARRQALAEVGLAGFEARHPRDLSSGERERLALATVLVTEPDLLVLDEPTRGIDPERKAELAGAAPRPGLRPGDARRHARPCVRRSGRRPRGLARGRRSPGGRRCLGS